MFNAVNILEALKNYIRTRGGQSVANNIAEAVNDLNSIPQGSGGDIPDEVTNAIETHGMGWTDEEEVEGFDIQWDGNTEGLESFGGMEFKVSETSVDISNLPGAIIEYVIEDIEQPSITVTENMLSQISDNIWLVMVDEIGGLVLISFGGQFEDDEISSGIYFLHTSKPAYTSRLYKEASTEEVVHPIAPQYLPEGGFGYTTEEEVPAINIEWDGNTEGLERAEDYVKISDLDIPNDQIVGLKYDAAYSDTHEFLQTIEITQELFEEFIEFEQINDDYAWLDYLFIIHKDGVVVDGFEFAHKGIYVGDPENLEAYISRLYKEATTEEVVHQIDQKYIPQSSGGAMIVNLTFVDFDTPITADKTLLELGEAFSNGIPVIARLYVENQLVISAQCSQNEDPYEACYMYFGGSIYNSDGDYTYYPIAGRRKFDDDTETRIDFWECPILG